MLKYYIFKYNFCIKIPKNICLFLNICLNSFLILEYFMTNQTNISSVKICFLFFNISKVNIEDFGKILYCIL